jgi:hypothetical protein
LAPSSFVKDFATVGSFGSGRWKQPGRKLVESYQALDVNYLAAKGCLRPGQSSIGQWACGNGSVTITLYAEAERLYLFWPSDGQAAMSRTITISRVPRYFGGTRPYFICSGTDAASCKRRVTKLYFLRARFLCRHCSNLVYASKYEQPWQQALRRVNKLRQRLGITETDAPGKPEHMPAPIYERRLQQVLQAELLAIEARANWFQRLIVQLERRYPRTEAQAAKAQAAL